MTRSPLNLITNLKIQFVKTSSKVWDSSRVLPIGADKEHIKTLFENGVLKMNMPKKKAS